MSDLSFGSGNKLIPETGYELKKTQLGSFLYSTWSFIQFKGFNCLVSMETTVFQTQELLTDDSSTQAFRTSSWYLFKIRGSQVTRYHWALELVRRSTIVWWLNNSESFGFPPWKDTAQEKLHQIITHQKFQQWWGREGGGTIGYCDNTHAAPPCIKLAHQTLSPVFKGWCTFICVLVWFKLRDMLNAGSAKSHLENALLLPC